MASIEAALYFAVFIAVAATLFAAFTIWLWMLFECVMYEPDEGPSRGIWLTLMFLIGPIGSLIYFCFRRRERIELYGE
ncbi:PLDc N-terminal domain-containing protein [Stratiformator vulcanicus]|uniref:Cardiolipin synthase N-terminal domain-containing protein n=1 Tax=Stratiformator vulcanicus TaxID=2527980 RepID=A0A517QZI3_9PLAN|nr:PLDc N-terminal domain-containing protein [Stratiformator vulcanicus]QDT37052.1 hypothetical protein Pan189_14180 [Stratiformator vulcanicus]